MPVKIFLSYSKTAFLRSSDPNKTKEVIYYRTPNVKLDVQQALQHFMTYYNKILTQFFQELRAKDLVELGYARVWHLLVMIKLKGNIKSKMISNALLYLHKDSQTKLEIVWVLLIECM